MSDFTCPTHFPTIDQVGVEQRASSFTRRSLKGEAKRQGLHLAVSMMDLTTLEGADSSGKIRHLCQKARQPMSSKFDCPQVAAVCVYPTMVAEVKALLSGTPIHIASVATGFPSGQYPLEIRLNDVRDAVDQGADEIDMVISRGQFLAGQRETVFDEIVAVKEACGDAHLKVIFETGELQTYDNIRFASDIAMHAGADFIKTSTGKISPAATMPVILVMLEAVRDFFHATGTRIGIKPAGGIKTAKQSLQYLVMVKETLGDDWLTPDLFRFGASSLLRDVELQLAKLQEGGYQAGEYFSLG